MKKIFDQIYSGKNYSEGVKLLQKETKRLNKSSFNWGSYDTSIPGFVAIDVANRKEEIAQEEIGKLEELGYIEVTEAEEKLCKKPKKRFFKIAIEKLQSIHQ